MQIQKLLVFLLGSACVVACKPRQFNSASTASAPTASRGDAWRAPVSCGSEQEARSVSLVKREGARVVTLDSEKTAPIAQPGDGRGRVRLDLCIDLSGHRAELMRVVFQEGSQTPSFALISQEARELAWTRRTDGVDFSVPRALVRASGLVDALRGDVSKLDVEVPLYDIQRIRIAGRPSNAGWLAVAGSWWTTSGEFTGLIGGSFARGDAFAVERCSGGARFREERVALGSARVTFGFCGDDPVRAELVEVRILDANEALAPEMRREFIISGKEEIDAKLRRQGTVRCASARLDAGHAVYAWTHVSSEGCETVAPDAPVVPLPVPEAVLLFRVRYGSGEWIAGESP